PQPDPITSRFPIMNQQHAMVSARGEFVIRKMSARTVRHHALYAVAIVFLAGGAAACMRNQRPSAPPVSDAKKFLDTANETMKRLEIEANQAGWVAQTYITDDTEA